MTTFGRQLLASSGRDIRVSADGEPEWKAAGITIDWSTVAAVSGSAVTIPQNNLTIAVGKKYLRFGQILCEITTREVQTITIDATGGTFTITMTWTDANGVTYTGTTPALAYNASAATVLAALQALYPAWSSKIAVSLATGVYTITFSPDLGNVAALTTNAASLTGGAGTAAVAVTTNGVAGGGKYGPFDPSATDGRQTLSRGACFILDETVLEENIMGTAYGNKPTDHVGGFDGGMVFKERILMTTGTHSLAAGPTVTAFEAAFPRISYWR